MDGRIAENAVRAAAVLTADLIVRLWRLVDTVRHIENIGRTDPMPVAVRIVRVWAGIFRDEERAGKSVTDVRRFQRVNDQFSAFSLFEVCFGIRSDVNERSVDGFIAVSAWKTRPVDPAVGSPRVSVDADGFTCRFRTDVDLDLRTGWFPVHFVVKFGIRVDPLKKVLLFDMRQEKVGPAVTSSLRANGASVIFAAGNDLGIVDRGPGIKTGADLPQIILAVKASCGTASHLDCRQKQSHEDTEDRDDDEKLHEGKAFSPHVHPSAAV